MIPACSGSEAPYIVYVLPLPVWPYAKTVELKPFKASVTILFATKSKTYYCVALGPKTLSNLNESLGTSSSL